MTEKQWYEDIPIEEFAGKHVRAVVDGGAVIEGRLAVWEDRQTSIYMGSLSDDGFSPLRTTIDGRRELMYGITRLDLVWDERDWDRIDVRDVRHGDAVVVNGRLCTVDKAWPDDYHPQVVTDAPSRMLIDFSLIPFALRRKAEVKVPMEPGYYRDRDGGFWKMWLYSEGHAVWQPMLVDIGDTCHMNSSLEMERLMPLTPVHFESGRAA